MEEHDLAQILLAQQWLSRQSLPFVLRLFHDHDHLTDGSDSDGISSSSSSSSSTNNKDDNNSSTNSCGPPLVSLSPDRPFNQLVSSSINPSSISSANPPANSPRRCKNLLFVDRKGQLFLCVLPMKTTSDSAPVPVHDLRREIGASRSLSLVPPATLWQALRVRPGEVTPLSVVNDTAGRVTVVLDRSLDTDNTHLLFHPLVPTHAIALAFRELTAFLTAHGHPPRIVSLPSQ